jgi:hypothetical protein
MAVEAILVDGIVYALRKVGLELHRRDGDAVQEEDDIEAVVALQRVADLSHDAQAVRPIVREDVFVDSERRLELREHHRLLEAEQLDAVAEHIERAALVQLVAQPREERLAGMRTVVLLKLFPGLGLRVLDPRKHVGGEERSGAVVVGGGAFGVEPAVGGDVSADLLLEADLFVQAHAAFVSL